jgi:hypothetical protein
MPDLFPTCENKRIFRSEYSDFYPYCRCLDRECESYELERCYSLTEDTHLRDTEICARVIRRDESREGWEERPTTKTRVVLRECRTKLDRINDQIEKLRNRKEGVKAAGGRFEDIDPILTTIKRLQIEKERIKREQKEGKVTCIQSKLMNITADDIPENQYEFENVEPTERMRLHPVEHFIALSSWVEGIKEYGVENIIRNTLTEEDLDMPFGFNYELQRQFIRALKKIKPDFAEMFSAELLMDIYDRIKKNPDYSFYWTDQRYHMLDHYFKIGCSHSMEVFEKCLEMVDLNEKILLADIAKWGTNSKILRRIYKGSQENKDLKEQVEWGLVRNEETPQDILKKLAKGEGENEDDFRYIDIFYHELAKNPSTPKETLHYLIDKFEGTSIERSAWRNIHQRES